MASEKILQALQMLYVRFGYPLQVHTDNAMYFRSPAMQEAFQQAGVRLTFTPTSNPQSNSVERTHLDFNTMSRVLCHQNVADWEEVLPAALLAFHSAVHESPGVTPSACLYGREPATPLDLVSKVPGTPLAANTYVRRLEDHQFRAHRVLCRFSSPAISNAPAVGMGMRRMPSNREKRCGCLRRGHQLIGS